MYLFSFFLFVSFALFPVVTWFKLGLNPEFLERFPVDWGTPQRRLIAYENVYSSLSFFSKVPLLITYGSGVLFQGSDVVQIATGAGETSTTATSVAEDGSRLALTIGLFATSIVVSVGGGVTFLYLFRKALQTPKNNSGTISRRRVRVTRM